MLPPALFCLQVQLNTLLVRLKEAQPSQFARVYELLADESHAVRHAVAELVATMLEEQGQAVLDQQAAAGGAPGTGSKAAGGRRQQRRKSGEGAGSGAAAATAGELQLAGLLQVLHLLANLPPEQGGEAAAAEEAADVRPLEREVVAQVVDALFDRWVLPCWCQSWLLGGGVLSAGDCAGRSRQMLCR